MFTKVCKYQFKPFLYILNQNNMTTLPTNFTALQAMDIILRMEAALAGEGNLIVFSLKKAIRDKQPTNLIIKTTQEMIRDNATSMQDVLGVSLVDRIKNFEI